jgi:hypothetical protein
MRQQLHIPIAIILAAAVTAGAQPSDTVTGTWTAEPATSRTATSGDEPRLYLQLRTEAERGGWSNNGSTIPVASFAGLPADRGRAADARFELRRDAGTFRFDGQFRDGRGIGEFRFEPDAPFRQVLASRGETDIEPRRLMSLALLDVSRAFIQDTERAFPGIALKDIIAFRVHGVTAEFRSELAARGFTDLSPSDLVKARIHRVTPDYIDEMRKAGFASEDLDGLVAMRIHRVTEAFIQGMAAAGYTGLTARELREASIHRVTPEFVRDVQAAGYRDVPLRNLVKMRIHRVTPEFIASLGAAGYRDLSIDQLVQFRIHGIDAAFIEDLKKDGYTDLSARELVEIRIHARRWLPRRTK